MPYESWSLQTTNYEGDFGKKEHCRKLINEIWMTEKKYVEDLIVVCDLKAKFDSFQSDSYSSRIMFGKEENSVERILLLHRCIIEENYSNNKLLSTL